MDCNYSIDSFVIHAGDVGMEQPVSGIFDPAGQWRRVEVRVTQGRVQAWLYGRKIADFAAVPGLLTPGPRKPNCWPLHLRA